MLTSPLPIDPFLPEICARLRAARGLVLVAEPGAGKTTRVPSALLTGGVAGDKQILVLQPRRLAARMAARRVAAELGEPLGRRIGYRVRFDEQGSTATRLWFLTEGVLTRRWLSDPLMTDVSIVVCDEFHERHLHTDLALTLLRRLQRSSRPDLCVLVMSATLDAEAVARFLGADVMQIPGRTFPVDIQFGAKPDPRPLPQRVAGGVRRALSESSAGDVLAFLPGMAEIRRTAEALTDLESAQVHRLHGDLSPAEQDAAVQPSAHRKVILATNIAESSLTIEGVTTVVDSGLARVAAWSPWSGLPTLTTTTISRASATQRAGRAGRVAAGRVLRLYTKFEHDLWPAQDQPEIARGDLAEPVLMLRMLGVFDLEQLAWFESPPPVALRAAEQLLRELGAVHDDGSLTDTGRRLARLPLPPRLGRLMLEAQSRGVADRAATLAALLEDQSLEGDPLDCVAAFQPGERSPIARAREQILRAAGVPGAGRFGPLSTAEDESLALSLLAAFPDRVGKLRSKSQREALMCQGGAVRLGEGCPAFGEAPFVAVAAREVSGRAPIVDTATQIREEWLLDLFPEALNDRTELSWNSTAERVESLSRMTYRTLVVHETRRSDPAGSDVSNYLAEQALARGVEAFAKAEELTAWHARTAFVAQHVPGFPEQDEAAARRMLATLCEGRRSFAELRSANLLSSLQSSLTAAERSQLERWAPERVSLAGGRRARINYERGKPPWIASRLQDFAGMSDTPRIAEGRVPLVVHLLAPNQRPVQITTDLASFWQQHYPALRQQLMRRYPRHTWP
ncbi:MAG: ATP-dependent helicase HrpB [Acidobacteriota bacterium]